MPEPEQWTPEDFEKATNLLLSGKGSEAQRERLGAAIDAYQGSTGNLGQVAVPDLPKVSRETRSGTRAAPDPFEAYNAETAAIGPAPEMPPGKEPVSAFDTAVRSAWKGMSLGMGDALVADQVIDATGWDPRRADEIIEGTRERREQGEEQHPTLAAFSEGAGAVLSPLTKAAGAVGGALGGAAGFAGKLGRAYELGMAGAFEGAAAGGGLADEGMTGYDAAMGAGIGAAAGPLSAFVLEPAAAGLGRMASRARTRSTGPTGADLNNMLIDGGPGAREAFGDSVERVGLHEGAGGFPAGQATPERYFANADAMLKKSGAEIGQLSQSARTGVDLSSAADELENAAWELLGTGDPAQRQMGETLLRHAAPMRQRPVRSYEEAHALRKGMDELVYKVREGGEKDTGLAKRLRRGVSAVRQAMDNAAAQEGPDFAAAMRQANEEYSIASQVYDYSAGAMSRENPGTLGGRLMNMLLPAPETVNSMAAPTLRQMAAFTDVSGAGLALPFLQDEEQ